MAAEEVRETEPGAPARAAASAVEPAVVEPPEAAPAPEPHVSHEPEPALPQLKLDWSSDLVQIETDPHKAQSAAAATAEETPASRPRRVRSAPVPVSEEPLVQVETRKPETTVGS